MAAYNVLFVCTGNICRSPTADGVLRRYIADKGWGGKVLSDSAGTHGYHVGHPPDGRAITAAASRGIDIGGLRARRLVPADFREFNLILAMDRGHMEILRETAPQGSHAELGMFLDFAPGCGRSEVPDPYYGSHRDFELVLDLVDQAVKGLGGYIEQRLRDAG